MLWEAVFYSNEGGELLDTAVYAITGIAKFCDISKSWRHVLIWIQWNGEKSVPFNFIPVNPTQTHWTSPLPDFQLQRNIESGPIFCFVSKGSIQLGTQLGFTLRLSVNVKSGIENFIWKKKKPSPPVELSVELACFWQHLRDKCCHVNKEQEQSLPLY